MKEKLLKDIEEIQNNLEILPKKTEKDKKKYLDYIDKTEKKYNDMFDELVTEIDKRYDNIKKKLSANAVPKIEPLDYNLVKILDKKVDGMEKMNLNRLFYELSHFYKNNLERVNAIILEIIEAFKKVEITLDYTDFNYSESVQEYMKAVLTNDTDINNKFEELFWSNHNLINQIEMNFKSIYYENERKINKFLEEKYSNYNYDSYLQEYMQKKEEYIKEKHQSTCYLLNNFLDKKIIVQTVTGKNIKETIDQLLPKDDIELYPNIMKLYNSLREYDIFLHYEYMINDFKKQLENKETYKDLYENKMKEISKEEKDLYKLTGKILSNSIFRPKGKKREKIIFERNNIISRLTDLYKELDVIKISNSIYKYTSESTTYLDALKMILNNFEYLERLLKIENDELDMQVIDRTLKKLSEYVYETNINTISNILITEDKNIPQIISDRYKMIDINLEEQDLEKERIEATVDKIEEIIAYYDLQNTKIDTKEIEFLLDVDKIKER